MEIHEIDDSGHFVPVEIQVRVVTKLHDNNFAKNGLRVSLILMVKNVKICVLKKLNSPCFAFPNVFLEVRMLRNHFSKKHFCRISYTTNFTAILLQRGVQNRILSKIFWADQ